MLLFVLDQGSSVPMVGHVYFLYILWVMCDFDSYLYDNFCFVSSFSFFCYWPEESKLTLLLSMIRIVTRHYILCKLWKGDKEEKYIKDCSDWLRYTDNIALWKIYRKCFLKELNNTENVSWMYVLQSKEIRLIKSHVSYLVLCWSLFILELYISHIFHLWLFHTSFALLLTKQSNSRTSRWSTPYSVYKR